MVQCTKPYRNCNATGGKVGNSTEKQLGMSVEFPSGSMTDCVWERNILKKEYFIRSIK
jgi:hypothetical protein